MLIRTLNHLGVCSSADTLACFMQHRRSVCEYACLKHLTKDASTVVLADNFLHSFSRVFCGNQKTSWHNTTVQSCTASTITVLTSLRLLARWSSLSLRLLAMQISLSLRLWATQSYPSLRLLAAQSYPSLRLLAAQSYLSLRLLARRSSLSLRLWATQSYPSLRLLATQSYPSLRLLATQSSLSLRLLARWSSLSLRLLARPLVYLYPVIMLSFLFIQTTCTCNYENILSDYHVIDRTLPGRASRE